MALRSRGKKRQNGGQSAKQMAANISLSLRTFTHHRLSIYWRILSLSRHAADRQNTFISFHLLLSIFFFPCISSSSFYLLSFPFLSFFLSFFLSLILCFLCSFVGKFLSYFFKKSTLHLYFQVMFFILLRDHFFYLLSFSNLLFT